jgi:hypothetical protein
LELWLRYVSGILQTSCGTTVPLRLVKDSKMPLAKRDCISSYTLPYVPPQWRTITLEKNQSVGQLVWTISLSRALPTIP